MKGKLAGGAIAAVLFSWCGSAGAIEEFDMKWLPLWPGAVGGEARDVALLPDGGVAVAGPSTSPGGSMPVHWLVKPDGTILTEPLPLLPGDTQGTANGLRRPRDGSGALMACGASGDGARWFPVIWRRDAAGVVHRFGTQQIEGACNGVTDGTAPGSSLGFPGAVGYVNVGPDVREAAFFMPLPGGSMAITPLGTLGGAQSEALAGVDGDPGSIVGRAQDGQGRWRACVWQFDGSNFSWVARGLEFDGRRGDHTIAAAGICSDLENGVYHFLGQELNRNGEREAAVAWMGDLPGQFMDYTDDAIVARSVDDAALLPDGRVLAAGHGSRNLRAGTWPAMIQSPDGGLSWATFPSSFLISGGNGPLLVATGDVNGDGIDGIIAVLIAGVALDPAGIPQPVALMSNGNRLPDSHAVREGHEAAGSDPYGAYQAGDGLGTRLVLDPSDPTGNTVRAILDAQFLGGSEPGRVLEIRSRLMGGPAVQGEEVVHAVNPLTGEYDEIGRRMIDGAIDMRLYGIDAVYFANGRVDISVEWVTASRRNRTVRAEVDRLAVIPVQPG